MFFFKMYLPLPLPNYKKKQVNPEAALVLLQYPISPDIPQTHPEKNSTESYQYKEIKRKRHMSSIVKRKMQNIGSVRKRHNVGKRLQEDGQLFYREKQPAKEEHGEADEIGKGLGFKYLAYRYRDEKSEKGGAYGYQDYCRYKGYPVDTGKVCKESGHDNGNKSVDYAEYYGAGCLGKHKKFQRNGSKK